MCILIVSEVSFYLIEWTYENIILRDALASHKKSIIESTFRIHKFDNINKDKEDKLNLLTNTIDRLEYSYYMSIFDSMYLVFRIIFVTLSLTYINIAAGILMFVLLFIPLLISNKFKNKLAKIEDDFITQKGKNLNFYKNIFDNLINIRILNARDIFKQKAFKNIDLEKNLGQQSQQYQLYLNSFYSLYSYTLHFLVIASSVYLMAIGKIVPGMIITLLGLTEQLSMPILSLSKNINSINSTKLLREQIIKGTLSVDNELISIDINKNIEVKNVEIEFGDKLVKYQDVNFEIGKKYLLEGESGSGKSVLMDIITGLRTFQRGQVIMDNIALENEHDVFEKISYIITSTDMFEGSGIFNILLTDKYTPEQIGYIKKFISEDKLINNDATELSTGEKRRILNMRGLMSNKPILIFDEPTSNLDEHNASIFLEELFNIDNTVIVVSHDIPINYKKKFDNVISLKK